MSLTVPDERVVQELLARHFDHIDGLTPLNMGQTILAYRFAVGGRGYILRLSSASIVDRLRLERLIAEYFASEALPIPATIIIGEYAGFEYGISLQAPGQPLESLPRPDVAAFIPAILATSDALCRADVSRTSGYGWLDWRGHGQFPTWSAHLLSIIEEAPTDSFYGRWHRLFAESFLEHDVFMTIYQAMADLVPYCPEDRYLVHGNFSLPNLIGQHKRITGVIDWADVRYGDFVFDMASLALWYPELGFATHFTNHIARQGLAVPHLPQRLRCYQLYIGLDALRFFAKQNHLQMYQWTKDRLLAILYP
ncbi:MAG: phosphotransferase [Anaerolineae bacterium]|nr:phosphotransferase [Anaerolineae bacterium]